eukprot:6181250-Pleurochrysis_carterae.AAC.3
MTSLVAGDREMATPVLCMCPLLPFGLFYPTVRKSWRLVFQPSVLSRSKPVLNHLRLSSCVHSHLIKHGLKQARGKARFALVKASTWTRQVSAIVHVVLDMPIWGPDTPGLYSSACCTRHAYAGNRTRQ